MTMNSYSVQFCIRSLVLVLLTFALFWPTLVEMEAIWRGTDTYMHCYFILPMALYMMSKQKPQWAGLTPEPALLPLLLMLPVLLLWLSAYAIDVDFASHIAQVVFIQLLLWHLLGNRIAKVIRFPLAFLIFAAPFGESLTPLLQEITADMSVALVRLVGIPVYREGLYLHTPVSIFEVAEACSGLNFLISSAVIALLFCFLYFNSLRKRIIFLIFVLVLAVVANGIRAFLLIYIGEKTNMAWGFGADHYYYGWAVFGITMLISFRIGEQFADAMPDQSAAVQPASMMNKDVAQPAFVKVLPFVTMLLLLVVYPLRLLLPETAKPDVPAAMSTPAGFNNLDSNLVSNRLGTTFLDGIRRSSLVNSQGIEFVAADYAVRQNNGDLITWHNRVFDHQQWTILQKANSGNWNNNVQYLQLANMQGERMTVLYWYQVGGVRTTNKALIKLLQLKAILLHEQVDAGVRVYAVGGPEFDAGKQMLEQYGNNH
jgi:exosortase A